MGILTRLSEPRAGEAPENENARAGKPAAVVWCPGQEFLHPYFERELSDHAVRFGLDEEGERPELAVMMSSTAIYRVDEGQNHDEETETDAASALAKQEAEYAAFCHREGLPCTIVRCANIVGTGMNGFAMELARGIARGTLMHIAGNEARISVVHAVDAARFGRLLAGSGETVNLTDGTTTPIHDLCEALAHRLDDKRIYTIKPRWARMLYGKERMRRLTTTLTFSNARFMRLSGGAEPTNVVEYLKTHVYDHESL